MSSAKIIKRLSVSLLSLLLISGAVAYAQQHTDTAKMRQVMSELGVGPTTMRSCFRSTGLKRGQKVSGEKQAEIGEILFTCLRKSNPDLTEDRFASAMSKLRRLN